MSSLYTVRSRRTFEDARKKKGRLGSEGANYSAASAAKKVQHKRLEKCFSSPPETNAAKGSLSGASMAMVLEQSSPVVKTKLHCYQPEEVAEELCLMDAELLRKIRSEELENGAWMKKDKESKAPNVLAMVHTSNDLAMLVPAEILAETSTQAMAKVIVSFIKIANCCHCRLNFNSLKAILAGLQCTPIYRLKKTWKEVPAKYRKKFEVLSQMMSEEMNYRDYRRALDDVLSTNASCIPFLGVLLTTIVQFSSQSYGNSLGSRRCSGIEDYTVVEAVTVRNRLEKLRKRSSIRYPHIHRVSSISGFPREEKGKESPSMAPPVVMPILEDSGDEGGATSILGEGDTSHRKESVCEDSEKKFRRRSNCISKSQLFEEHEDQLKTLCKEPDETNRVDSDIALSDISLHDKDTPCNEKGGSNETARQESFTDVLEHYTSVEDDSVDLGRFCRSVPVRRKKRRNGTSVNVLEGSLNSNNSLGSVSSSLDHICSDSFGRVNSISSISSSDSSSSTLYHEVATLVFKDSPRISSPQTPKINRCASDQKINTSLPIPPSIHNSISMECIRDVMTVNPFEEEDRQDPASITRSPLKNSSSANSMGSDEGICVGEPEEEAELSSYSPDLITPPPVTADYKILHREKSDSTLCLSAPLPIPDRHSWDPSKSTLSELSKFYHKQEKAIQKKSNGSEQEEDEEPAVGPIRKRSRRRASNVLKMALAPSMPVKDWKLILSKYQMLSLGCSIGSSSQQHLRSLILNYPRNPDALNYKLSHQREPSNL